MIQSASKTAATATEKPANNHRRRRFPAPVDACFFINIPAQAKNRDGFGLRVHDPVFRDAALGIVAPLVNQISFRLLFAHHFQGEVGAQPETVLPARIGGGKQQQKIGLTELARPDLQPQRGEMDFATPRLDETEKGKKQELQASLWCLSVGMGRTSRKPSVNSTSRLRWSVRTRYSSSLHRPWGGSISSSMSFHSCADGRAVVRVGTVAMAFPGERAFIPKLSILGNVALRDVREGPGAGDVGLRGHRRESISRSNLTVLPCDIPEGRSSLAAYRPAGPTLHLADPP